MMPREIEKHFPDFRRVLTELQSYAASGKIDEGIFVNLKQEICERFHAKNFQEVVDKKMWMCPDFHPTPEMHLEYLDAVLPDWQTWN